VRPRFRPGEIVRLAGRRGEEAVVEEIAGPNEAGSGWVLLLRSRGGEPTQLAEDGVEPTGLAEGEGGERVPLGAIPVEDEFCDRLELLLFTGITDGIEAASVAAAIERELADLMGGARVSTEAERHWSEPYNYELAVTVVPEGDAAEAFQILAEAGGEGWLGCRDDGWRCDLWWSATRDPDAMLIVPQVHAAEVAFVPWSSPARRAEAERPLVPVTADDELEEAEDLDAEAGDEEA
jgi:hypothetical protein